MEKDSLSVKMDDTKEKQTTTSAPEPPNISKTATLGKKTDSLMEQQVQKLADKVWSTYNGSTGA